MNDFQQILDSHPNPAVIHIHFRPVYANQAFAEFNGFQNVSDILSMDCLLSLIDPPLRNIAKARYQITTRLKQSSPQIVHHKDRAGRPVIAEIVDKKVKWQGQDAVCTYITLVTDKVEQQSRLQRLLEIDDLTQIHNRRYIRHNIEALQKNHIAQAYYIAILDIDYFKKVNDTYGHINGDKVLIALAKELQKFCIDHNDHLGRIGGEEFVMLLKADDQTKLYDRLEKIRQHIAQHDFQITLGDATHPQLHHIHCTLSFGVTRLKQGEEINQSYQRADSALYQAKALGRNKVVFDERCTVTSIYAKKW